MSSKPAWKPTAVQRFIKSFPTSAGTALVLTDAGQAYIKPLGNAEGPHILACEVVATQLAKWFGLSTFDFAIIEITDANEIPFHSGGIALPGPAFATRAESGDVWGSNNAQLKLLSNPQDLTRLVVFDTWCLNCDRYSEPPNGQIGKPRINRDNVFLSEETSAGQLLLKAMDHTHCFTCGRELTTRLAYDDKIKDPRVFGLFPEFRPFLDRDELVHAVQALQAIERNLVHDMMQSIPTEWDVRTDIRESWTDLIVRRAAFVAETIESKLWPQLNLEFGE